MTDAQLRKRYEREHGVFIGEGPNVVRELLRSRYRTRSLLLAEERVDDLAPELTGLDAPVYVVGRDLLYEVVRFKLHQGVVGCGERAPWPDPAEVVEEARVVVVLEGLNDHENLGSLFRSARAFGVDAVLLAPGCADPLYRRCVRVSMGHVLHLPTARLAGLGTGLELLRSAGFTLLALTPSAGAVDLSDPSVPGDGRVALLLGAEGPGLSREALQAADVRVRIPIHPQVDSLNVATAGALAFYALGRARPVS